MKILIKYCPIWDGYDTKALEVSKEIKNNLENVEVEVIEGGTGEFSVIYEADPPALLFSKKDCGGRFPTDNEISNMLISKYKCENRKTERKL